MGINLPQQSGRFLVEIGSEVVANFQECTGLSMEVEIQEYSAGGENEFIYKLPGRVKYTNITLKCGVTDNKQFASWRPKIEGGKISIERKNISIILLSHAGETVRTWQVAEAFPIKWTGPDMRVSSMEVAIESLELVHEGWRES